MSGIANSTVPTGSTEHWKDKKRYLWLIGLVVPSLAFIGYGAWLLTGVGAVVLDRPGGDPGDRAGDRPVRRAGPLQPARRRDRGAGAGPLLPLDHLPVPADPVRRVRRRDVPDRPATRSASAATSRCGRRSAWRSRSAASAASASTPRTSSATSARRTSAGCRRSRWRRASTATSTSSTTAATTSGSPRPRTRRSSRVGENFYQFWPRTVCGSLQERVADREASLRRRASTRSGSATTCSTPG